MIENVSHITFVVKDLEKTTALYKELFDAQEVYYSGDKTHSLSRERFFIIGGQWIAVMENKEIVNRTYHHVAFNYDNNLFELHTGTLEERLSAYREVDHHE